MATNFEFYKDDIQKCLSENNIAIKNNKPVKCVGDCNSCIRDSGIGICMDKPLFEWIYAEHIEQPKLTKRERAFCEAVQTGWIARDEGGELYWFHDGFKVEKLQRTWNSEEYSKISSMGLFFEFIKWEDETPWSVEDLSKLEVQEDA